MSTHDKLGIFLSFFILAVFLFTQLFSVKAASVVGSDIITTIAGIGTAGFSGDGAAATSANINTPEGIVFDSSGNLFFTDKDNNRVRKVDTAGIITTFAGNGNSAYSGDGGPAVDAGIGAPTGIAFDSSGNLFITANFRVRKIDTSGIITTYAGTGSNTYSGDGGPATDAGVSFPSGLAFDSSDNLFIAENQRIRKVDTSGIITTIAGTGTPGFSGDGGPATSAKLNSPTDIAFDSSGNLFFSDKDNDRIRKIDTNGIITTVAGGNGDLWVPRGIVFDGEGNLLIADYNNSRVRKMDTSGIITTVAGDGSGVYKGDGGAAIDAGIDPVDVAAGSSNNLFIVDQASHRIRKVTVTPPPAPPAPAPGRTPIVEVLESFIPKVEILAPKKGGAFAKTIKINYSATDQNDVVGPKYWGLGDNAVSIFYSVDEGVSWTLIAEGLQPAGSYAWDVSDLAEGNFYQIKVKVLDKVDKSDEEIAGPFAVDRSPPEFSVSVDPPFTRGENVTITVQATESLEGAPTVVVTQRDHSDVQIFVSGEGSLWNGEYEVEKGYDGTAKIRVVGRDMAGNTGNVIRAGGVFNVGVIPPPSPIITSPLDNDVVYESSITIKGKIRKDTKAVLFIEGEEILEVTPDRNGDFIMKGIELSKTRNRGMNILQIGSEDAGGILSELASLNIKFNAPPVIGVLSPQAGDVLQARSIIEFLATDENGDNLTFSIEISADNGETWRNIAGGLKEPFYVWDTSEFVERNYILRITASDGFDKVSVVSSEFSIENFRPSISFENKKTIINADAVTIDDGSARSSSRQIIGVEYSFDGGTTWLGARAKDGSFDSPLEAFLMDASGLTERLYEILVRTRDSRNFVGEATKILIVDYGPPPAPAVTSPPSGGVLGFKEDADESKSGTQINLRGRAERDNALVATIGEEQFEGVSDASGNFSLQITLREHGANTITLYAIDPAGNRSESDTTLQVVHNNPPDLRFLRPKEGGAISGIYDIVFEISDRDLDAVTESSLSYRKLPGGQTVLIARDLDNNLFSWDVKDFSEGSYELILQASDGVSKNSLARGFIIDNTPPSVSFEPLEQSVFATSFVLEMKGSAEDNSSGIAYAEYSIDQKNWFKALITGGYKEKKAAFRVKHPFELADGTYNVMFRSTDLAGNVSEISGAQEIIIDTTPPRIGSYMLSVGSLALLPEGEVFKITRGAQILFRVSLEGDTKNSAIEVKLLQAPQMMELAKKEGLWQTEILFSEVGEHTIFISAEDSLGNKTTDREVGAVQVMGRGKVFQADAPAETIENVKMTILALNKESQSWTRWQAEAYGLSNPVFSDEGGEYNLLLPGGQYKVLLQKSGFQRMRSSDFEVLNPRFISFDFELKPRKGVRGFFEDLLERIPFLNF